MTREEAKDLLLNISAYDIDMQRGMAKQEAIEMAIQALEQEPCEDAISRQAAIDVIENEQKKIMRSDWAIDQAKFSAMSEIRELITDLPSVSTEKTGQWEEYGTRQVQILPTYRCSVCGEEYLQSEHFKYCPNCGAKNATTALQGRK